MGTVFGLDNEPQYLTLKKTYRTTEEIRKFAFGLLNGVSFDDLDDNYDNDKGCQSLTHGDRPEVNEFATPEQEMNFIIGKIHELEAYGVDQKSICIVARTHRLLDNYISGLQNAGIKKDYQNELYNLAIKLLVIHWYENREIVGSANKLAFSLENIITQLQYCY